MAKCVLRTPDHIGVAAALRVLHGAVQNEKGFEDVRIDLVNEFREACTLSSHASATAGFEQLRARRAALRQRMPSKIFSTVHKAKGLESEHVLVLPCDKKHFADAPDKRCLLYVALSRAKSSLTLVASPTDPSPLIAL
jgi:DNA helicase-2/ATP-dependent DNA helicase PcrA